MLDRETLIDALLAPHGARAAEAFESDRVARGLQLDVMGDLARVIVRQPLLTNPQFHPLRGGDELLATARSAWMPFLSRAMRERSLREQMLGRPMRPAWSILVNPVVAAACELAGIPRARLARTERDESCKPIFPRLAAEDAGDLSDTPHYRRDGVARDGEDYLAGQYLLNDADHVARHALQLLEDTRLPIRSVSDNAGRETMVEIRILLPDAVCAATVGRPLSDVLGLPGFEPGTDAGDVLVTRAQPNPETGRTTLHVERRFVPATPPPDGADMRWVGMTPAWA